MRKAGEQIVYFTVEVRKAEGKEKLSKKDEVIFSCTLFFLFASLNFRD